MTLDYALAAAKRGWPVFPVKERDKVPVGRWTEEATTDVPTLTTWLAGTSLNYGIACGPAGLVVVDEDEPDAADELARASGYDHLPATFTVTTGKGRHFYYRANGTPVRNGVRKVPGIDVRAEGGYVVGPGSTHTTGARYEVVDGREALPLPSWLARALNEGPRAAESSPRARGEVAEPRLRVADEPIPDRIGDGTRRDTILSRVGSMRARGATLSEALIVARFLHQRCDQPPGKEFAWNEAAAIVRDVFDRYDGPETEPGYSPVTPEEVEREARTLRIRAAAREQVAAEQAAATPAPPFDADLLADVLARPADPPHRVEGLIPTEAGTLVVAQRKTGKTTLMLNLARSLLTGEDFLARFAVRPLVGRVALLNFEVSAAQVARWADEAGVPPDRLYLVTLRGRRNPLGHPDDRAELADRLREQEVEALMVDPFGRAYTGQSQNDPGEVGAWLAELDRFARGAGVVDLILATHAGWNGERSRGASALEDWADSILTLTRDSDDEQTRYLRAEGRDVLIEEDRLDFDPHTRQLTLTGAGSRTVASSARRVERLIPTVVSLVQEAGGLTGYGIDKALSERGDSARKGDGAKAANLAADRGLLDSTTGPRNSRHFLPC